MMIVPPPRSPDPAMKIIRLLLLLGFILTSAGCMQWQRTGLPAPAPDAPRRLGAARVTTVDGRTLEMDSVVVTADSIVGSRATGPGAGERLALHHSQVRHMDRRGLAFGRTVLLTTIVSLIVTVLAATAVLSVSC
jgi:hypothetical protein